MIETTWSHPFYIRGKGWVKAEDLVEGDVSQTEGKGSLKITKIHVDVRGEEVYNFEVEEDHNYYVSEAGVLVHNSPYNASPHLGHNKVRIGSLRGYSTSAAPRIKFRLPKSNGKWQGTKGNSKWFSDNPAVKEITKGRGISFKNGSPNFSPYKKYEFRDSGLNGTKQDFAKADSYLAAKKGFKTQKETIAYRQKHGLVWHHHEDMVTMQLVPKALHNNIPHTGGAALLRLRSWLLHSARIRGGGCASPTSCMMPTDPQY